MELKIVHPCSIQVTGLMMKNILQLKSRSPIIINTIYTLLFFVHAAYIGYGIKYPDQPSTKLYSKDINELDVFPISFKLCVKELENPLERYKKVGYSNVWDFYKGLPDSSGSWVGWSGNNTGNNTRTSVEGTKFLLFTLLSTQTLFKNFCQMFLLIGKELLDQLKLPPKTAKKSKSMEKMPLGLLFPNTQLVNQFI